MYDFCEIELEGFAALKKGSAIIKWDAIYEGNTVCGNWESMGISLGIWYIYTFTCAYRFLKAVHTERLHL